MKTMLIATAIAITSLSALADTAGGVAVSGDLGYSAAASQAAAPSAGKGSTSAMGAPAATGLSREQVRAELDAALRNGDVISGEFGASAPTRASMGSQLTGR